jgi:hypothetical protein
MLSLSNIVNNNFKEILNNNSKIQDKQGPACYNAPCSPSNILRLQRGITDYNKKYIQIKNSDLEKFFSGDYLESSSQLVVLLICFVFLNKYNTIYDHENKKITAKKIHNFLKEICGGKSIVGKTTIHSCLNYLLEQEILLEHDDKTNTLFFEKAYAENCTSYLRLDQEILSEMIRLSNNANSFAVLFFYFFKYANFAFYDKTYSTATSTILKNLGGLINSTSTLNKIHTELESKGLLFIKHAKPNTGACNEYCIGKYLFERLVEDTPYAEFYSKIEHEIPQIEAEEFKNRKYNKKSTNIENPFSGSKELDNMTEENPTASKGLFDDLIKTLEQAEEKPIEKKSVQAAKFQLEESDSPSIPLPPIEKPKKKVVNNANFGLIDKYPLSTFAHVNLNKMRVAAERLPFLKNFSPNQLLYMAFKEVDTKGAYPFKEGEKREIRSPLDQYLTNNTDGKGMIFEKVLATIKENIDYQKRLKAENSPEERARRDFIKKQIFLRGRELSLGYSVYDKIEEEAFNKLSHIEQHILKTDAPWKTRYNQVSNKLNVIINYLVEHEYAKIVDNNSTLR